MDFKLSDGFFDLCINVSDENKNRLNDILLKLYEMGYKTVMLNQTINESTVVNNDKKKRKKGEENTKNVTSLVPDPINVCELNEKFKGKLRVLNRITFICSNPIRTHALAQCANLKKYNLYAIMPTKQEMLEFACSQLNVDLITIIPSLCGMKLKRKLYRQAVGRDLCFEIQYVNLLNRETRIANIHYCHLLYMYYKCTNVIISSGADRPNLIRNPYDIINLASMLGLSEIKSKAAILDQCQLLLLRAERRVSGKAIFTVEFTEEPMEEDDEDN